MGEGTEAAGPGPAGPSSLATPTHTLLVSVLPQPQPPHGQGAADAGWSCTNTGKERGNDLALQMLNLSVTAPVSWLRVQFLQTLLLESDL